MASNATAGHGLRTVLQEQASQCIVSILRGDVQRAVAGPVLRVGASSIWAAARSQKLLSHGQLRLGRGPVQRRRTPLVNHTDRGPAVQEQLCQLRLPVLRRAVERCSTPAVLAMAGLNQIHALQL